MIKKLKIQPSEILQIDQLFTQKGWEIEDDKDFKVSLYQKFIDRYERLDLKDRGLFLELSNRFLRIKESAVYSIFRDTYNSVYSDFLASFNKVFIMPLVPPYIKIDTISEKIARPKIKSGEKIKVYLQSNEYRELQFSEKIVMPDTFIGLKKSFSENEDLLILIDDFIGSGRTVNDILSEYFNEPEFNHYNTLVLALVGQNEGVEKIYDTHKVVSFFHYKQKKGVTDYYLGQEREDRLIQVLSMENKLKVPPKYSLGYGKSEALVSIMNKSPNNTLPVFWHETKKMAAPFHRYVMYNK